MDDPDNPSAKRELREELLAARRARPAAELASARAAVREHVLRRVRVEPELTCVAAYVPLRTEPGSVELLAELRKLDLRVIVPRTLPDHDLDWVAWPSGETDRPLGVEGITAAGVVLVPALAVAADGTRLGRGGGSYDRALRRVRTSTVVAAVVFDDEHVPALPRDPWDVPVEAAVSPTGWRRLAARR
jgi:5-formyltetrahydrofolate cyclo-ligase